MSLDTLFTFIFASTILSFAPGPDNIFVLTQSALHGRRAGFLITLGLCTGLVFHTSAVAFGLAAIFMVSIAAFTILKFIGAAYLVYLACQAFKAAGFDIKNGSASHLSDSAYYRRGIFMNLTNPKIAIFFIAFLPQFANPQADTLSLQLLMLGFIFIIVALIVFFTITALASLISDHFKRSPTAQTLLNRIAGVVFIGLALRLALSTRN